MDINKLLIIFFSVVHFQLFSQGFETQKKFALNDEISFTDFINSSKYIDGFSSHYHSRYTYYDLYLDSDNNDLFKMNYSLRFRKRIINDSLENYTFQLKDEMNVKKSIRMEVEEKELYFYNVKHNDQWIPLTNVLDTIFNLYNKSLTKDDSISYLQNLNLISKWINIKANGSIAPFQKLRHIDSLIFSELKIKNFSPVLIGSSVRIRGHIYIDSTKTAKEKIQFNRANRNNTPLFFQENKKLNWLFESSLDNSFFIFLKNNKTIRIKEFEVENKFINPIKGQQLLIKYEEIISEKLDLHIKYDSKYKQSIQYFINN